MHKRPPTRPHRVCAHTDFTVTECVHTELVQLGRSYDEYTLIDARRFVGHIIKIVVSDNSPFTERVMIRSSLSPLHAKNKTPRL
jgi:hypothetical protein